MARQLSKPTPTKLQRTALVLLINLIICTIGLHWRFYGDRRLVYQRLIPTATTDEKAIGDQDQELSLHDIQSIVDVYVDTLSQQNYRAFNDELIIRYKQKPYAFSKYSLSFLDELMANITVLVSGDSMQYYWTAFIMSQLQLYRMNNPNNCHCQLFTHSLVITPEMYAAVAPYNFFHLYNHQTQQFEICWDILHEPHYDANLSVLQKIDSNPLIHGEFFRYQRLFLAHSYGLQDLPQYPAIVNAVQNRWPYSAPNAIYINFAAFHLLHLYPWRPYEAHVAGDHPEQPLFNVIHLEQHFDAMVDAALHANAKCVIFRGANPICDGLFSDGYENAKTYYDTMANRQMSHSDFHDATSIFHRCLSHYNLQNRTDEILVNYSYQYNTSLSPYILKGGDLCSHRYTLLNHGANEINQRMRNYVNDKQIELQQQQQNQNENNGLKLIFFNVNRLFSNYYQPRCVFSDSRHYQRLMPLQVNAVTNIMHKFCT